MPYPKQLVPLAALRVVMGKDADLLGPRSKLIRWFWCGILGELYGGAIETRFVRDLEQVGRLIQSHVARLLTFRIPASPSRLPNEPYHLPHFDMSCDNA